MSEEHNLLIKRYLLWCYKTTKEEFERIERKFTQLEVDQFILDQLKKELPKIDKKSQKAFLTKIDEFNQYMKKKSVSAIDEKFERKGVVKIDYLYLKNRLSAIEAAAENFLGEEGLKEIKSLYQKEFENRILQAREHS